MEKIITIQGTHCVSCKVLIEDVCGDIPGLMATDVDYTNGQTKIEYQPELDWGRLKKEIESLGEYKVIL